MGAFNNAAILFLLLCVGMFRGVSTEDNDNELPSDEIEKGIGLTKDLLEGLDNLGKWMAESKKTTEVIEKVLKVFGELGKIASSFGFIGALISFIMAFIPQSDPKFIFMKQQFAEVNRKLDSVSQQISSLQTEMEWTNYASEYGKDEYAIKNSWAKMKDLMEKGPIATTAVEKSRLAEQFTSFYSTTGTESSVANLYRYITERNPASLNRNLLQLVTEKSNGNFKVLTQYSSYFTTLMVSGLQMNIVYYKLKGYDAEAKAKESATQLSDTLLAIQDALIDCANDFEKWATVDVKRLGTEKFSKTKDLAEKIKKHLDDKFIWYDWTVIAHSNEAELMYTYGNSITLSVQDKTLHVIHRQKEATVDQTIVNSIKNTPLIDTTGPAERVLVKDEIITKLGTEVVGNIEFLHVVKSLSDYVQTRDSEVKIDCDYRICGDPGNPSLLLALTTMNIFLKSKEVLKEDPCSKLNCHNGECKPIKDTTLGFCRCRPMYRGSTCEESIQSEMDYAATESKINAIIIHPVPDLSAIYHDIRELKEYTRELVESLQLDIQWTQILVKYIGVIQKFRYIARAHKQFKDNVITRNLFISEVGQQFTGGQTFLSQLTKYNDMMMGSGFGDTQNILDVFRYSIIFPKTQEACTETYVNQTEDFARIMFTLEKEAMLAWQKYLLMTGESKQIQVMENLFKQFVSGQWKLFNQNGCGPLTAAQLDNKYCEKPYHSTNQQKVTLKCVGDYKPYPATVQCMQGKWSAVPMCVSQQVRSHVKCTFNAGATVCEATCTSGWSYGGQQPQVSRCTQQPCRSFTPKACNRCTANSVCKDHEVCETQSGSCRDGCLVHGCGVNAQCSYKNHQRTCTCISPWKGDPISGCNRQDLKWVLYSGGKPANAVVSKNGLAVCRVFGQGEEWHPGYVKGTVCSYEWDWNEHTHHSYEVLVDPCGGSGYEWQEGYQYNAFMNSESKKWPGVYVYICSVKKNNMPGKLFNTRHGFMCHIPVWRDTRHNSFYSLVPKPCL